MYHDECLVLTDKFSNLPLLMYDFDLDFRIFKSFNRLVKKEIVEECDCEKSKKLFNSC